MSYSAFFPKLVLFWFFPVIPKSLINRTVYRWLLGIILLVISMDISWCGAQTVLPKQTIRGVVMDKYSRSLLPGANILLLSIDSFAGCASDNEGRFRLNDVPVGRHMLQVSFLGFKSQTLGNIIVTSAKETVLEIELEEKIIKADEVVITATTNKAKPLNQMAVVSGRTFSVEETSRYAGSFRDPARLASNFAGVSSSSEQRNDIIIRGNSPLGLLWRFEGLDIPNPNHFVVQGTNGGPISILNNNLLANSGFYSGAFPAEYGNALAGVFDLKMRNGNNETHEFIGQFGLNGTELSAEGPFNKRKRASYLINYRYSTWQIIEKAGIDFGAAGVPQYQDISFKFNLPTENLGVFKFFGMGGVSNVALLASLKEETDNSFGLDDNDDIYYGSDMGVVGLSHTYFFNEGMHQKIILAVSGSQRRVQVDTLADLGADPVNVYNDHSLQDKWTLSWYLNKKYNARHTARAGVIFDRLGIDFDESLYDKTDHVFYPIRKFNGSSYFMQSYVQSRYSLSENIVLNSGLHSQYFFLNKSVSVEPRLGLSLELDHGQNLSFGYGYHSQLQMMEVYFYESRDSLGNVYRKNENLGFTGSHHLVMGYDNILNSNLRFKTELYGQYLNQVPVNGHMPTSFSVLNLGSQYSGLPKMDSLSNSGEGYNYGLELTFERFFSKGYYYLVTTSLFESKYRGSDKELRNTVNNGNYILNLLGGKEIVIGGRHILALDIKFTLAGGKRYTPIDVVKSHATAVEVLVESQAYSLQFDPYHRVDARISFRNNAKKVMHEIAFDVQNVFNRRNVLLYQYNSKSKQIETEYQLGIFPVLMYRIEF